MHPGARGLTVSQPPTAAIRTFPLLRFDAVSRRPTARSSASSLDAIFRPRAVAVIGASRRVGAIGRQVVANILESGFTGPVYPVNARTDVVLSMPTYPSVSKIRGPVDLAVLCVPAAEVVAVAKECGKKGVKGLVVTTAGFREIGGEGVTREVELMEVARRYGMRLGLVGAHTEDARLAMVPRSLIALGAEGGRFYCVPAKPALGERPRLTICTNDGTTTRRDLNSQRDLLLEVWGSRNVYGRSDRFEAS